MLKSGGTFHSNLVHFESQLVDDEWSLVPILCILGIAIIHSKHHQPSSGLRGSIGISSQRRSGIKNMTMCIYIYVSIALNMYIQLLHIYFDMCLYTQLHSYVLVIGIAVHVVVNAYVYGYMNIFKKMYLHAAMHTLVHTDTQYLYSKMIYYIIYIHKQVLQYIIKQYPPVYNQQSRAASLQHQASMVGNIPDHPTIP